MVFSLKNYLGRMNIHQPISCDINGLFLLHQAHFYNIPFENLDMDINKKFGLALEYLVDKIVHQKRGGICYELNTILAKAFDEIGFKYWSCMARIHSPILTSATHQVFIIEIEKQLWLFDIGFGAKGPRSPILLEDGYIHTHSHLSTKIKADKNYGWIIYVKENIKPDAEWEAMYSFYNQLTTVEDIEMAYFFTFNSNNSLLNKNKVISLPLDDGRISIRNNTFIEIRNNKMNTYELDSSDAIHNTIKNKFGIELKG